VQVFDIFQMFSDEDATSAATSDALEDESIGCVQFSADFQQLTINCNFDSSSLQEHRVSTDA